MKILSFLFVFLLISFISCRLFAERAATTQIISERKRSCGDSLIELSGYYIKRFEKKNIISIEQNRQNRLNNKPYKVPIDAELSDDCFLPVKTDNIDIKNKLHTLFKRSRSAVYLYCNSVNYSIFNAQFCDEVERIQADNCFGLNSNRHYTLNGADKYCYQVFYLSGKWAKGLATTYTQKSIFREQVKYVRDTTSPIHIYLLNKVFVSREVNNHQLQFWKEVSSLFEN